MRNRVLRVSKELEKELKKIKKELNCSWTDASTVLVKRMEKNKIEIIKMKRGGFKI